jgi:hypothetical protein
LWGKPCYTEQFQTIPPRRRKMSNRFLIILIILACPVFLLAKGKTAQGVDAPPLSLEESAIDALGFSISLKIFNSVTGKPQTTFYFGDDVGYEVTANIPPSAEGKKATVNLSATVKIGGVTIPYATSHIFSGPVTNPSYNGNDDMYEPKTWNGKFRVPANVPIPEVSATVKVDISIQGIGTSRINQKITIKTKQQLPKPVLSYPSNGSNMINNIGSCSVTTYQMWGSFSWNSIPWASKYEISITNIEHNFTFTYTTEKEYFYPWPIGCIGNDYQTWKWKVRAGNHFCWSDWSNENNFIVKISAPSLVSPNDNSVMDNGCSKYANSMQWYFDWSDVPGATQYNLVVYRTGSPSSFIDISTPSSYYTYSNSNFYVTDLYNWKWKVRAAKNGSFWSDWSAERNFSVEPVNTDCP